MSASAIPDYTIACC